MPPAAGENQRHHGHFLKVRCIPNYQNVQDLNAFDLPYSKSFRVQIHSLYEASQGMLGQDKSLVVQFFCCISFSHCIYFRIV